MTIIDYFHSDRQTHWLKQLGTCQWDAGKLLYSMLLEGKLEQMTGKDPKVLLLVEGDALISFCTYAKKDDIQPTELSPWMGFVYTFPQYRGNRYVGLLFDEVTRLAKEAHVSDVYISTNHIGLYEKYGCTFKCLMNTMGGDIARVYVKHIE